MTEKMQRVRTTIDPFEPFAISQAIAVGEWLFVSGQAALTDQGQLIGEGDFQAQAEAALDCLAKVLAAADSGLEDVVKVTLFLTDISHFPTIIELRKRYFTEPYPADTIVEVSKLALPGLMFEIEAIAVRGAGSK